MGYKPIRCAFVLHLLWRFAERQGLCLRKDVGEQHRVMAANWVERFVKRNEITRDDPRALVNKLIKGVLAVGTGLAPVDWAGVEINFRAVERNVLTVAFH